MDRVIPSPYEWAGGFEAIQVLFKAFYTLGGLGRGEIIYGGWPSQPFDNGRKALESTSDPGTATEVDSATTVREWMGWFQEGSKWNHPKRLISQRSRLRGARNATAPRGRQVLRPSRRACAETRGGVVLQSIHGPRDE
jgi:hypothetical protein